MARPEVDWPIPVYVTELRDRVVMVFRVAPRALAERLPAPLAAERVAGRALVALALGNGRCLKGVGGTSLLAREFRTAELVTPAVWPGACRPAARGLFLLRLFSDSVGVARLVRAALGFDPELSRRVILMIDRNEYKRRQAPPGVKITGKAFGRDRRLPITNRFHDL